MQVIFFTETEDSGKSEVGSQKSEVRSQKSEVGSKTLFKLRTSDSDSGLQSISQFCRMKQPDLLSVKS